MFGIYNVNDYVIKAKSFRLLKGSLVICQTLPKSLAILSSFNLLYQRHLFYEPALAGVEYHVIDAGSYLQVLGVGAVP